VGGGFFGLEAADALRRRKCQVTIVECGPRVLPQFGEMAAHHATAALGRRKVKLHTDADVVSVQRRGKNVVGLLLVDGTHLDTDLVLVAAGVRPRSELLSEAGAAVRDDGTVVIDRRCQTTLPDVYACGASVALEQATTGLPIFAPQASLVDKTAQVAGSCAAGGNVVMGPVLGSAVTRVGDTIVACTGLSEQDAYGTASVTVPNSDRFMPGCRDVHLEIYYDADGYVVGAEAAGGPGTEKRIDVLAAAIMGGLNVDQLATLDLCYAAPFAQARDAVNAAATVASSSLAGLATAWTARSVLRSSTRVCVDVRDKRAFDSGHIEGSSHLELSALRSSKKELTKLARGGPLVFISDDGAKGYLAARIARSRGHASAGYLTGGMQAWLAAGYEVEA
jgi:rhodanese-related sulfurtransferase